MLGLPAEGAHTYRQQFPSPLCNKTFAFHCDTFLFGQLGQYELNY